MRRIPFIQLFAPLVAGALAGACTERPRALLPSDFHGIGVTPPIPKPDFTLTATDGNPYSFRERTTGQVALLFFGYTSCPDVCPVHAANVAAVLRELPWADRQRVTFVFVTTDPDRDSLPAIRKWLNHFDSTFVGLRGPADTVNKILAGIRLPGSFAEPKRPDGSYGVGHASAVLAFAADDSARVLYIDGVRQQDWAADLPKLLAIKGR